MDAFKLADGSCSSEYKVGDKFIVVNVAGKEDYYNLTEGSIIKLCGSIGSEKPSFTLLKGDVRWALFSLEGRAIYELWDHIKPYKEGHKFITSVMNNSAEAQLGLFALGYKWHSEGKSVNFLGAKYLYTNLAGTLSIADRIIRDDIPRDVYTFETKFEEGVAKVIAKVKPERKDSMKLCNYLRANYSVDNFGLLVEDIKNGNVDFLKFTGKD